MSAKAEVVVDSEHNQNIQDDIAEAARKVTDYKAQRTSINSKIKAVREDLEAKGIDKKAFDNALKYHEQNLRDRDSYDDSYQVCMSALAKQTDLFDTTEKD